MRGSYVDPTDAEFSLVTRGWVIFGACLIICAGLCWFLVSSSALDPPKQKKRKRDQVHNSSVTKVLKAIHKSDPPRLVRRHRAEMVEEDLFLSARKRYRAVRRASEVGTSLRSHSQETITPSFGSEGAHALTSAAEMDLPPSYSFVFDDTALRARRGLTKELLILADASERAKCEKIQLESPDEAWSELPCPPNNNNKKARRLSLVEDWATASPPRASSVVKPTALDLPLARTSHQSSYGLLSMPSQSSAPSSCPSESPAVLAPAALNVSASPSMDFVKAAIAADATDGWDIASFNSPCASPRMMYTE
eukprot:NODE_3753_length_1166_cov_46.467881_g3568_i0.p1 GENE.NODE_3753_length_1166_cov_46.467881_g3568_i0~~NODE_3753_length_1166_cov_46.467881_g3568_i0.p1  ORF type:complete len:308 (+),score=36.47 NODE_3753_length_1166_cov_46.467881_g3568_i0:65-988(+)